MILVFAILLSISIPIGSCDLWRLVATCGFEVSRGQLVRGSMGSMALALAPPANVPWFGLSSLSCHYHVFLFSQSSDEIWWNMMKYDESTYFVYFTSSDPHPDTLFWRSLWHAIWQHIWHIYIYIYEIYILKTCIAYNPNLYSCKDPGV